MRPGTKRLLRFLEAWLINTLAVLVAYYIVPGIHFGPGSGFLAPFIASFVLGMLNAFIRPILLLLALPLLLFTLGLFMLVINALLLYFVGILLAPYFQVDSFGAAFFGAIIISVVAIILHALTGAGGGRVSFHRRPRPPQSGDDDHPVIDV
jgi:putative membrane protein